jgi:hypothetical protein
MFGILVSPVILLLMVGSERRKAQRMRKWGLRI